MLTKEQFDDMIDDMAHALFTIGNEFGIWSAESSVSDSLIAINDCLRHQGFDWTKVEPKSKLNQLRRRKARSDTPGPIYDLGL